MRMLRLDEENRQKAKMLIEFAEKPENHYIVGVTPFVPGDRPEYVTFLDDYRCVFTVTKHEGRTFRHLSMSVPSPGALPNVLASFTVATWFGFTGAPMNKDVAVHHGKDWQVSVSEDKKAVVFLQELTH